jgi:hypothetical protein
VKVPQARGGGGDAVPRVFLPAAGEGRRALSGEEHGGDGGERTDDAGRVRAHGLGAGDEAPAARRAAEALDELVDGDTRRAKQEALANGIDEAVAVVRDWIVQWLAHRDRSSTTPVVSILGAAVVISVCF